MPCRCGMVKLMRLDLPPPPALQRSDKSNQLLRQHQKARIARLFKYNAAKPTR